MFPTFPYPHFPVSYLETNDN
uniref:Uncharacterized protein n=1 Tax=Rhizophora mucronata TaxID=61149 RepID=A0A2P2NM02_RHIMU